MANLPRLSCGIDTSTASAVFVWTNAPLQTGIAWRLSEQEGVKQGEVGSGDGITLPPLLLLLPLHALVLLRYSTALVQQYEYEHVALPFVSLAKYRCKVQAAAISTAGT